ncbi:hypothetical protein BT63DRAFT_248319 [Microthyrium microscopicum]|uniref:F-box domain-containing protein n=1 Tax=Microthyrium microscopicum TaxID=703497 RepID=A0A6A6U9R6_9PEZI|nr:hypothetical protein BT63DRAFT_248319 [Microthyrium microscopicum]
MISLLPGIQNSSWYNYYFQVETSSIPAIILNTMNKDNFTDEDVFVHLSHRPTRILQGVISTNDSTKPSFKAIEREHHSSLGRLSRLPLEILHETLVHLDIQSLLCLSHVCAQSKAIVDSIPIFSKLATHASHIFTIFHQAKILNLHSISTLYEALQSDRCVSCGAHGPFLHVLLASRCCAICSMVNQSLWVTSLPLAMQAFALTKEQVGSLQVMWSIPGKYGIVGRISRQQSIRLVNVRAAKVLALGDMSMMDWDLLHPLDERNIPTADKLALLQWYRAAPLSGLRRDPCTINDVNVGGTDRFCEMGVVPFPTLVDGAVESGLWCRGCKMTYDKYIAGMDAVTLSRLIPKGCDDRRFLFRMTYKSWSKAELVKHAKICCSAAAVISEERSSVG